MQITEHHAADAFQALRPNPWTDHGTSRTACCFETRRGGRLRTFGVLVYQLMRRADEISATEASAFANVALARPEAAARGKIAVLGADGLLVLQADAKGGLNPALCGNATAAAILALRQTSGQIKLAAAGANRVDVEFECSGSKVRQGWLVPAMTATEFTWRGHYCVRVRGLNDYTIVTGGLPVGLTHQTCRLHLATGNPNAKFAVLGSGDDQDYVEFYNSSGRHGAAPMTGLASLAVAAHALPRFAARLGGSQVSYMTMGGLEICTLPSIGVAGDGRLRIALPEVDVSLTPMLPEVLQ